MVVLSVLLITACAADDDIDNAYIEEPVEQLYNKALNKLKVGEYAAASAAFDEVDRQHPYSVWATKSQLMSAYAQYQNNAYAEAIIIADRFIQLHPSNRDVPYAYYLKAISFYEQISDVGRDQKMTELAMKSLNDVVLRFPRSKYARDSQLKIDLTRDHLAGKEMEIGRYYENRGQYLAAINRFRSVVDKFQTTTHVPEALHRLTESYLALGLIDQANKTAAVLGHNFPGTEWYADTYEIVENKKIREPEGKKSSWFWPF